MTDFRIGTSSFTAAGWESSFYPAGMKPADYLTYYATKFNTIEIGDCVNRSKELHIWVYVCQRTLRRGVSTFVHVNNHHSGHSTQTVADFLTLWNPK